MSNTVHHFVSPSSTPSKHHVLLANHPDLMRRFCACMCDVGKVALQSLPGSVTFNAQGTFSFDAVWTGLAVAASTLEAWRT